MAQQQAHSNTLLLPVLAGLAGAGIALLFAPKSGRETRAELHKRAMDAKQRAAESYSTAQEKMKAGLDAARDSASALRSKTKDTQQDLEELKDTAMDAKSRTSSAVHNS